MHTPTVGVRTGDTSAADRRQLVRHPPDILITTPESLFLMLTSQARDTLANVEAVIIDEIHAMAGTKRGAHLMFSLERLRNSPSNRRSGSRCRRPNACSTRSLDSSGGTRSGSTARFHLVRSPLLMPVLVKNGRSRSWFRSRTWPTSASASSRPDASPAASPNARFDLAVDGSTAPRADRGAPLDTCVLQRPPLVGAARDLNELAIEKASGEFDGTVAPRLPSAPATNRSVGALRRARSW